MWLHVAYGVLIVILLIWSNGICYLIRPFCIMLSYQYLLHYGLLLHIISQYLWLFSLILQGLHEEGESGSWNSGLEKEQILETYSAQLQKSWNFMELILGIYKKYWAKKEPEGGTSHPQGWRAHPTPLGAPPDLVGPLASLRCPSSAIWCLLPWKNHREAFGTKSRRLEAEPVQNQSRAPAELFYRETSLQGGESLPSSSPSIIS